MARTFLINIALVFTALHSVGSAHRAGRGLVGLDATFGRVERLAGQLDSVLGATTTGGGATTGREPQGDSPGPWWATSEALLTRVLQDADAKYLRNLERRARNMGIRDFLHDPAKSGMTRAFLDALLVPTYQCADETRFGNLLFGGRWVCLSHYGALRPEPPVVLMAGEMGDTSFARDIFAELGVVSHAADFGYHPELAERTSGLEYIKAYNGLSVSGAKDVDKYQASFPRAKVVTILDLVERVGAKRVDILKLDCEGCEHAVVEDLSRAFTRETVPFGQILIELHLPGERLPLTFQTLARLEDLGYRLFHSEINRFTDKKPLYHYNIAVIHDSLVQPRS